MTRLASLEQGGYYPTPFSRLNDILPAIQIEAHGYYRLFDPCAGKGAALAYLADNLRARYPECAFDTVGIEISDRADQAAQVLGHVVKAPFEAC